jgi:hypothetical protein
MNAVIVAFLLPFVLGWFLSFLAFVIVWLISMVAYGIWMLPHGTSLIQSILMIVSVGVAGQVGYFANVFLRSMLDGGDDGPAS